MTWPWRCKAQGTQLYCTTARPAIAFNCSIEHKEVMFAQAQSIKDILL